jgi:DNA-binding GntR family transcriptional regulator
MWATMTVPNGTPVVRPGGPAGFDVRTGIDEGQARELNAVAGILEALALSLSPRFDDAAIAELRSVNERFRSHRDHGPALAVDDHDLHRRLCESCGDERLLGMLAPVRRAIHG